jgi:Spy/CpxP family protein refolding chaperone
MKRTSKTLSMALLAVAACAALALPASAQGHTGGGMGGGPMGGGRMGAGPAPAIADAHPRGLRFLRCLAILDLTDAQKADIKALVVAETATLKGLHDTLATDRQALVAALGATTPDACAVGAALLKVHADREAIRAELAKIATGVESLLTAEQKTRFEGCVQAPNHGPMGVPADDDLAIDAF